MKVITLPEVPNLREDELSGQNYAEKALDLVGWVQRRGRMSSLHRQLAADHPDTALSLNNLGTLLQAMGELAGARPYYERALAILEAKLGPDHPHTKIARGNLQSL